MALLSRTTATRTTYGEADPDRVSVCGSVSARRRVVYESVFLSEVAIGLETFCR